MPSGAGHVVLVYDERNPAFQKGGKGYAAYEETRNALLEPDRLKKCSWQQIARSSVRKSACRGLLISWRQNTESEDVCLRVQPGMNPVPKFGKYYLDYVNGVSDQNGGKLMTSSTVESSSGVLDPDVPSTPVTREALYALVWSEPMLKVAARYDVSSSYLGRICTLLNVPRPERGYWAKLAVGKAPQKPALQDARPGDELAWSRGQDQAK